MEFVDLTAPLVDLPGGELHGHELVRIPGHLSADRAGSPARICVARERLVHEEDIDVAVRAAVPTCGRAKHACVDRPGIPCLQRGAQALPDLKPKTGEK